MKVTFTIRALEDIEQIELAIARDNPRAAVKVADGIIKAARALARFPRRGRLVEEFPGGPLREILRGSYRIVYAVKDTHVEVLTVFHVRRELPRDLP